MEKFEEKKLLEKEEFDPVKLKKLIESDQHTMLLTAARMALKDLEVGDVKSAVARLLSDSDKLRITNRELYEYIRRKN